MSEKNYDDAYRRPGGATEATQILQTDSLREAQEAAAQAEADDRAAQRARERAERGRALGKVPVSDGPDPVRPTIPKPTTDKFVPSLGLFLLRLVTGGIMGVHGVQKLTDIAGTQQFLGSLGLPSPQYLAWGTGIAEVLAGVALVFGLLTRLAGLGVAVVAIAALALVKWTSTKIFESGQPGFAGELELLLAAVGLTLLFVGAGRWSIDGAFRTARRRAKMSH
ncbi:DoxX family protein [Luteococcus sp. OSA5]|uniref:DoxX family protein n=1 Tax=Luteococcus sp. OSA5 TaxID=3401630 RepID=UPI003B428E14